MQWFLKKNEGTVAVNYFYKHSSLNALDSKSNYCILLLIVVLVILLVLVVLV